MPQSLRRTSLFLLALALAGALAAQVPIALPPPRPANSIKLLALNQPPCAVPTARSVLKLKLAYRIAEAELSTYGFAVSVKFQSTEPGHTFSTGPRGAGELSVTSKSDTLTLTYPLASIWQAPQLRRPLTCYLYLHRNLNAHGRSMVIAQTPAIVLQACP